MNHSFDPIDPINHQVESPSGEDTATTAGARETEGAEYTSPDGSHGLVYTPRAEGKSKRRAGKIIVAVAVTAVALSVGLCLIFTAWMAATSLGFLFNRGDFSVTVDTDVGTSDGLHISGDTDGGTEQVLSPEEGGKNPADDLVYTIPSMATIAKLPPKRQDTNGDGRADVETDATGNVLTSAGENPLTVATVVARVADSVVEITTETVTQSGYLGQYITSGAGSGVVIAKEGFIVTNAHVIEGATSVTVRMRDGTEFSAKTVGSDTRTDIAVLWIDAGDYPFTVATLGSSFDLVVGEDILAIGNPLGSLGGTVTEGMVSATARQILVSNQRMTLLQVSAPINPGNSGGGLFNLAGELVGIVNAKVASEEIEGLGFAIPVDTVYEIVTELISHGYVRGRPTLDFTVVDVTSVQTAVRYFNTMNTGVYVYDKNHGTVRYGDYIVAADGCEITSVAELSAVIANKSVGDTLELTVYRAETNSSKWVKRVLTVSVVEDIPR